ncbi:MAG TPA: D-alanyl-D-alanine carboxypeptidase, partial [Actinobacteria bacterium]|nr:D-alanyl-D-alanine carboxypeptidase [Actinomycetota bacterium]
MNGKLRLFAIYFILIFLVSAEAALATTDSRYPKIISPSGYVIDRNTGQVLFSRAAEQSRPVASTTKIMTGLLVLELADLDATVTISNKAAQTQGGTIGLVSGETRQVRDLLHAMMLASANDAAVALAEHLGEGSEGKFVGFMNDRAKELGALNTNFINPHGLADGELHFSSAKDLATIAYEAMKRSDFRELVSTRRFTWDSTSTALPVIIKNTNELLDRYPLAIGIKTGYTN